MANEFITLERLGQYTQELFDELFNTGKNKLNTDKYIDGYIAMNGYVNASSSYKYVWIAVKAGDIIRTNQSMRFVVQYDEGKNYIAGIGESVTSVTATNNGYLAVSVYVDNWYRIMLTINEALPSAFEFYYRTYKYVLLSGESLIDGSAPANKMGFLVKTANLFDYTTTKLSKYCGGNYYEDSTTYNCSDYIPVEPGKTYTLSSEIRNAFGYNKNKVLVQHVAQNTTSIITIPDGIYFVIINMFQVSYSHEFMMVEGTTMPQSFVPYGYDLAYYIRTAAQELQDGSVTPPKTSFIHPTVNLFNKDTIKRETFTDASGAETANNAYHSSAYIPVVSGKTYTLSAQVRSVVRFSQNGTALNYYSQQTTVVNANWTGYMVLNLFADTYNDKFMVVEGTTLPSEFIPYGYTLDKNIFIRDFSQPIEKKPLTISKNENVLDIISTLKDGTEHTQRCLVSRENCNYLFNFQKMIWNVNGTMREKSADDDITPFRLNNMTVGANHGFPCLYLVANTDKTNADIGSQWKDGDNKIFTLFSISQDGTQVGFVPETQRYDGNDGVLVPWTGQPTGTLSPYIGVTHVDPIVISSVTQDQVFPIVTNRQLKILLGDNVTDISTTESGSWEVDELNVYESYDIVDYASMLDYMHAHIGTVYNVNNIPEKFVRISLDYKFLPEGKCVITTSMTTLKDVVLAQCGLVQSQALYEYSGETAYYYVGNVNTKNGIDLSQLVSKSALSSGLVLRISDLTDPNIPLNKAVNVMIDNTTHNRKFGIVIGYIIDRGITENATRLSHTRDNLVDIRTGNGKMYPAAYAIYDKTAQYERIMPAGKVWTGVAFRAMLGTENPKATSIFDVKVGNDYFVYIDYNQSAQYETYPLKDCIGCEIEILQSNSAFELLSDIVDDKGVNFNINGTYGWAVLKVHK